MDPPNTIAGTDISLIDCEENTTGVPGKGLNDECNVIAAIRYEPTVDRSTQMKKPYG